MEWLKTHYKILFSSLLTIVFICSMVFLIPTQKSYAYEYNEYLLEIAPEITYLNAYSFSNGSNTRVYSDSSGVAVFSNSVESSGPYLMRSGFSTPVTLFSDYGIAKVYYITVRYIFKASQFDDQSFSIPSFQFGLNSYVFDDSSSEVSNLFFSVDDSDPETYGVSVMFELDASSLTLQENNIFWFELVGNGAALYYNNETGYYMRTSFIGGSVIFAYSTKTSGDVANDKLDNIQDTLTTPTTDIPVDNSQVSDDADRFNSAVDDYLSAEDSINQSIEGIYDTYQNDPLRFGESILGLVDDTKDIANSNVFSAVWSFVKVYPLIYWLVNIAIVFAVLTFLLRR